MINFSLSAIRCRLAVLLLFGTNFALAQNLPNIQKNPVYLTGVKIDGQALELNGKFQAYNKAIDAYYTFSNDEQNLYLTLKVKYGEIVSKVLLGGITLTLNHAKAKRDPNALSVTFPFLEGEDRGKVANLYATAQNDQKEKKDKGVTDKELNTAFKSVAKTIKVEGLPKVETTSISIYNEENIRASSMFDGQLLYTYELAVPLKLLSLPNNGSDIFSYQIKINPPFNNSKLKAGGGPPPPPMMLSTTGMTDLWAEYKLVKK